MVRFAWRTDINKKAKIMVRPLLTHSIVFLVFDAGGGKQRKVKFPTEFDAVDLTTDELKAKLLPVSRKLKEFEQERSARRKVRKRTKNAPPPASSAPVPATDVEMADASGSTATASAAANAPAGTEDGKGKEKVVEEGGELEHESVYREKEAKELEELISPELKGDVGCSATGLYDLVGQFSSLFTLMARSNNMLRLAIITHKGAAADSGHYIGFVKKSVFHGTKPPALDDASSSAPTYDDDDDDDWYKFDDDKVSVFPKEKLTTIDGGGTPFEMCVLSCFPPDLFSSLQARTHRHMYCCTRASPWRRLTCCKRRAFLAMFSDDTGRL